VEKCAFRLESWLFFHYFFFYKHRSKILNLDICTGFVWQCFGSRAATGVASVRSCQKLPLCLIEPIPASSKTDPLLAEAEPISNGGRASVMTYLRRGGKKLLCNSSQR